VGFKGDHAALLERNRVVLLISMSRAKSPSETTRSRARVFVASAAQWCLERAIFIQTANPRWRHAAKPKADPDAFLVGLEDLDAQLTRASGSAFCNTSRYDLEKLLDGSTSTGINAPVSATSGSRVPRLGQTPRVGAPPRPRLAPKHRM
jgi:hypothetical protein